MLRRRVMTLFLGVAVVICIVLLRTRPAPAVLGYYYLHRFSTAYGWGDNLRSLVNSFRFSQELNRTFLLDFHSPGREDAWFASFFVPRDMDWSTTNISSSHYKTVRSLLQESDGIRASRGVKIFQRLQNRHPNWMPIVDGSSVNVLGVRPGTSLENRERVRRVINDKMPALVVCPVHFIHSRESAASFSVIKRLLRTASPLEAHFERVVSRTLFGIDLADSSFQPRPMRPLQALQTFIRERKDAEPEIRALVVGLGRRLRLGELYTSQGLRSELLKRAAELHSEVGRYVLKWLHGVSNFSTIHFRAGDRQLFRPNPSVNGVLRCMKGHPKGDVLFLVSDATRSIPDEWLDNVVLLSAPDVPTTSHLTSFRSLERDFRGMVADWLWMLNSDRLVSNTRSGFSYTASLTADIPLDSCYG